MLIGQVQNHGWAEMEVPLRFKRQCIDLESIIYERETVPINVGISVIVAATIFASGFKLILTKRFRAKQYQKEGYKPRAMIGLTKT